MSVRLSQERTKSPIALQLKLGVHGVVFLFVIDWSAQGHARVCGFLSVDVDAMLDDETIEQGTGAMADLSVRLFFGHVTVAT